MSVETANNTMAANVAGAAGTANDAGRAGTVFRFKFHPDINAMLQRFAGVHHGDDLEEFKDSWETLLARYRTAIDIEIQRLQEIGFTGDVENKMFVSVRYYYCKQFKIGRENNTDDREEQAIVQTGAADAGAADAGAAGGAAPSSSSSLSILLVEGGQLKFKFTFPETPEGRSNSTRLGLWLLLP